MKNNSLPLIKRSILFVDQNENNIVTARKALEGRGISHKVNAFSGLNDLNFWLNSKSERPPKCIFYRVTDQNSYANFWETISDSQSLKNTPIILIIEPCQEMKQFVNRPKGNVLGYLQGPFNEKSFIDMVYSIRIYWENMNYTS